MTNKVSNKFKIGKIKNKTVNQKKDGLVQVKFRRAFGIYRMPNLCYPHYYSIYMREISKNLKNFSAEFIFVHTLKNAFRCMYVHSTHTRKHVIRKQNTH